MIDRLTSKRLVLVVILAGASLILVSGSREWVSGTVGDAALGAIALHGKGSEIAPGAMGAALVGLASAVAAATSGRVVRVVAASSALLAAVLGAGVVISILADPGGALGSLAATGTGRSGSVATQGRAESWALVALVATLAMGLGGLGALVGAGRWRGLSSSYDSPVASGVPPRNPSRQPAPRRESEWDQLSRGKDPTSEP